MNHRLLNQYLENSGFSPKVVCCRAIRTAHPDTLLRPQGHLSVTISCAQSLVTDCTYAYGVYSTYACGVYSNNIGSPDTSLSVATERFFTDTRQLCLGYCYIISHTKCHLSVAKHVFLKTINTVHPCQGSFPGAMFVLDSE